MKARPPRRLWRILLGLVFCALTALMVAPHLLPWVLERIEPEITFRGSSDRKELFLTIDDAPSEETGRILEVLDRYDVKATFFITAAHVHDTGHLEELVHRGHRLANHLNTTRASSRLTFAEFQNDFERCAGLLPAGGAVPWYRPSSDFSSPEQIEWVQQKGYRVVLGTVFPLDHWINTPWVLERLTVWLAIDGGIVILHDGRFRGPVTAEVLDRVIPVLLRKGYRFATLDELHVGAEP